MEFSDLKPQKSEGLNQGNTALQNWSEHEKSPIFWGFSHFLCLILKRLERSYPRLFA